MSKPATTEAFLELGIRSGLLDRQRLLDFQGRRQANGESLDELSAALVHEGLLTEFQAEKLLQGRWKGFVINSKYRLLERVGAGGMGCVYLAEHVLMQRRVALKVLPLAQARDAATVERFYFEARAAARLDHANIVRAHDIDRDGNLHFLVLEYVDGANLHEFIRRLVGCLQRHIHVAIGVQEQRHLRQGSADGNVLQIDFHPWRVGGVAGQR
jgi:hypothetical protein